MIIYILLFITISTLTLQNILCKQFGNKTKGIKNIDYSFNFSASFFALIISGIYYAFNFSLHLPTLYYSIIFSIAFSLALIFNYLSIQNGSLSLTSLFFNFSLIIPSFYGLIVLKEQLSIVGYIGLFLLLSSLVLTNKIQKENKPKKRWIIFIIISVLGNGVGAIIQKVHQINYPNLYTAQFMFVSMIFVTLICFILCLITKPQISLSSFKTLSIYGFLKGLLNISCNLLMLYLASKLPATILYTFVTAGGIILTFIVSFIYYKEKLSKIQYLGYLLGVVSIILLQL